MNDEYYWVKRPESKAGTPQGFEAAKVVDELEDGVVFEIWGTKEKMVSDMESIVATVSPPVDETLSKHPADLVDVDDVSDPQLLHFLKSKFMKKDIIYSSIGGILISVNPYKNIDNLYSNENLKQYLVEGRDLANGGYGGEDLAPHVWRIALNAYVGISTATECSKQAVVISGESGSGKTEATKRIMTYLSAISDVIKDEEYNDLQYKSGSDAIESRVMAINPMLESFGNAKTSHNNNSSRFGRWLEIYFEREGKHQQVVGANITQYLLEKIRVVSQAKGERNYHIFYQLCSDKSQGLGSPSEYVNYARVMLFV